MGNQEKKELSGTNLKMAEPLILKKLALGIMLASLIITVQKREQVPLVMDVEKVTLP